MSSMMLYALEVSSINTCRSALTPGGSVSVMVSVTHQASEEKTW